MSLVPAPFLFRYSIPVKRLDKFPRAKSNSLELPETCRCPWPSSLEPGAESFAAYSLGWNEKGLALEVRVAGRTKKLANPADLQQPGDRVWIWIDTRNTQGAHRASRFSHHFVASPLGGGKDGQSARMAQLLIPRAKEDAPTQDFPKVQLEAHIEKQNYRLSMWFPTAALHGYDPEAQRRLGFYLVVQDQELGTLPLVVGQGFPFDSDPSQWITLQLRVEN